MTYSSFMLVEFDLPIRTNQTLLNIFKTMHHGTFALVHSVGNKIWCQSTIKLIT